MKAIQQCARYTLGSSMMFAGAVLFAAAAAVGIAGLACASIGDWFIDDGDAKP